MDRPVLQAAGEEHALYGRGAESPPGLAPVAPHVFARQPFEPDHRGGFGLALGADPRHVPIEAGDPAPVLTCGHT